MFRDNRFDQVLRAVAQTEAGNYRSPARIGTQKGVEDPPWKVLNHPIYSPHLAPSDSKNLISSMNYEIARKMSEDH